MSTERKKHLPRDPRQGGWVLMATLVLSAIVVSVTVTYARHAVLAKRSLEFASGASPAEEASRSGLDRTRDRMREGHLPGTEESGTEDVVTTPGGEIVTSERVVIDHDERNLRVRARGFGLDVAEEANLRARGRIVPSGEIQGNRNAVRCETGDALLLAGNLTIISGDVTYQDTQLAGLMLLEAGAHLTLEDVVLRGTIITRAGLCNGNTPQAGANRPRVSVYGGLRLLAGTELPDVAVAGPDLRFHADSSSRLEVRGMVMAEEFEAPGRGAVRGMCVSTEDSVFGSGMRRPGHGRGLQSWSDEVEAGAESVRTLAFPYEEVSEAQYDAMDAFDISDDGGSGD